MQLSKPKTVDLEHYEIIRTIGQGGFGTVKLAKHKLDKHLVAIKLLKKWDIIKRKQVDHVHDEVTLLSNMKHHSIVGCHGFTQDEHYLYIIMDFIQGGEFFIYLRSVGSLNPFDAGFFAAQVTLMFEYLQTMNIAYRDLKPENLLIGADGYLKLTDFGFAKVIKSRTYTVCGTPEYIAPEVLLNKGHGTPVDWWALGILIYEMIHGIDPFTASDPMQIYKNIIAGKIRFSSKFDPDAKSLVKHLVVSDLSKRYGNLQKGVQDIKQHRYFKHIDWEILEKRLVPPSYKPKIKSANDDSCFQKYKESTKLPPAIKKTNDPFLKW